MLVRACAGRYLGFVICLVVLTLLAAPIGGACAQDVLPGYDLYITDSGSTEFDFGSQPLPAGFFGPGSDPFDGGVPASGLPLPQNPFWPTSPPFCTGDDLTNIDTIVRRIGPATLPSVGSFDVIDIEIVALSLESINPITVTYGGLSPELWDVVVWLSPNQVNGNMLINKTHLDGGTFDMDLPVAPLFVFTRQSDNQELILDGGAEPFWLDTIEVVDVPWEYDSPDPLSCRSNFCAPDPFVQVGTKFTHGVVPTCGQVVPTMPVMGMIILIAALAGVGVLVIRRVSRRTA
jgi:hypothetical protein